MIETIITQHEIQAIEDGKLVGKIEFSLDGNELSILHTYAYEKGKGIGTLLMKSAVEWAETSHFTIMPICPFAAKYLQSR
jgi:predicted GNAT family acetyltransferase